MKVLDRYKGCLIGGAIGDALGAPVENMGLEEIRRTFGEEGITDFEPWDGFAAGSYSDDTQLTLATARGCIKAAHERNFSGMAVSLIYEEYLGWLKDQDNPLMRRRPGRTCLSALSSGQMGTVENPINDSKGCGGLMRVSPVGLAFPPSEAFYQGARVAAITHGHPSGYLPAGFLADAIARLVRGDDLGEAVEGGLLELARYPGFEETLMSVQGALGLLLGSLPVEKAIANIGKGWIATEALAIALYLAFGFSQNWLGGVLAAVNHSGDSDSTAAITGSLLGTWLGLGAIPRNLVQGVEDSASILSVATQMYEIFHHDAGRSF